MNKEQAEELVNAIDAFVSAKIADANTSSDDSCGGFSSYAAREKLVKVLTSRASRKDKDHDNG